MVVEAKKGLIHMEMVVECPLVITPKVKPFSRPNQEFGIYMPKDGIVGSGYILPKG